MANDDSASKPSTPAPKPATGSGLLGKVGAKPGGSIKGLVEPQAVVCYSKDRPERILRSDDHPAPTRGSKD